MDISTLIGGLATGFIYAMLASAFALIYKVSKTLNLALGAMLLAGGYFAVAITDGQVSTLKFLEAVALACVLTGLIGALAYRLIARPLIGAHVDAVVIATIGLDLAMRSLLTANDAWAVNVHDVGAPWGTSVTLNGHSVPISDLVVIATGVAMGAALGVVFRWTNIGLSMRACAEDGEVALAQGISIRRNLIIAWVAAGVICALVGILVGAFPRSIDQTNFMWAFRALPAAVLGGMGSIRGAFVGGIVVGYTEILTLIYQPAVLGAGFYLVSPFALMLVILLIKPQGLFGPRRVARA